MNEETQLLILEGLVSRMDKDNQDLIKQYEKELEEWLKKDGSDEDEGFRRIAMSIFTVKTCVKDMK